MHILFIPSWLSVDKKDKQLGSFFMEQAEELKKRNIEVGFLYINRISLRNYLNYLILVLSGNARYGEYQISGINFILKPFFSLYKDFFNMKERLNNSYISSFDLYVEKYGKPDIIHFHSMISIGAVPELLSKKYNIPIVITEHYSGYALKNISDISLKEGLKNLNISSKFFAVSDFYRDNLNDLFSTNKIKTLPNNLGGLVLEKINNIKKNNKFTFVCVGNLFPVKNQKLAIYAFYKFLEKNPSAQLNIIGSGQERKRLEGIVNSFNIQNNVTFLGKLDRDQTLSEISKAHVLLVTSIVETFSVVTIEAFALQTLVISTKCGGPEMLINQSNGIISEDEASSYAQAMIEIYEKYDSYDLLKVQNSCIAKYSGEKISSLLESEYLDIINGKIN